MLWSTATGPRSLCPSCSCVCSSEFGWEDESSWEDGLGTPDAPVANENLVNVRPYPSKVLSVYMKNTIIVGWKINCWYRCVHMSSRIWTVIISKIMLHPVFWNQILSKHLLSWVSIIFYLEERISLIFRFLAEVSLFLLWGAILPWQSNMWGLTWGFSRMGPPIME